MGAKLNEQIRTLVWLGATGKVVTYTILKPDNTVDDTGPMVENPNKLKEYYHDWTPDEVGVWRITGESATEGFETEQIYHVGMGQEKDIKDDIAALNDISPAEVEAECVDALESFILDTLIATAGPGGVPVADSYLDYIMNIDVGQTFDRTTDSLEALGAAIAGLTASVEISFTENREIVDGTNEIQIYEQQVDTYIRDIFLYSNLDTLETAGEGGIVTIRAYHRVDGAAYSDQPDVELTYAVGVDNEYPNFGLFGVSEWVQVTMQCSVAVTAQRACPFRGSYRRTS